MCLLAEPELVDIGMTMEANASLRKWYAVAGDGYFFCVGHLGPPVGRRRLRARRLSWTIRIWASYGFIR